MPDRSAFIAGATGAVGNQVLECLLAHKAYQRVTALVRRPLAHEHGKLGVHVGEFEALQDYASLLCVDDVYCCLGTTLKRAGSKAAFERVDHDYVVELATLAAAAGARQFVLVSAIGADPDSVFFYSRVKGRTEREVCGLAFAAIHVFQPALLLGPRAERRAGETMAKAVMPLFNPLLAGPLAKYRGVAVTEVAAQMVAVALAETTGVHVHRFGTAAKG